MITGFETGNILNFNVGATVDLDIPRSFWSRLAGKYGNMFYWKEKARRLSRLKSMIVTFCVFLMSKMFTLCLVTRGKMHPLKLQ